MPAATEVPPKVSPPFDKLPELIKQSFDQAVKREQISIYAEESLSTHSGPQHFEHILYVCPDLEDKPGPPSTTPDLSSEPDKEDDPFSGRAFPPGQGIADVGRHYVLTNTSAMRDEHFMIVPKEFRAQAGSLIEEDLGIAYSVIDAYQKQGRHLLGFFNGGPHAGASQAHLHMQFVPFIDNKPFGAEKQAIKSGDSFPAGKPFLLPTPHVHYVVKYPTQSPSSSELLEFYRNLLDEFRAGVQRLPADKQHKDEDKRDSYNLLITKEHMHLIPRFEEGCDVPHERTRQRKKDKGDDSDDVTDKMTFNGFTYAGIWFVGSEAERDDLLAFGLETAMLRAGYQRTESWELDYKA